MYRKLILFVLALTLCFVSSANAANIVWVSENLDLDQDGLVDDWEWIDILESLGHDVYSNPGAWDTLDEEEIALLNDADLVIFSRCSNSGGYAGDPAEVATWNAITAPMILMNAYLTRGGESGSTRWFWVNSTTMNERVDSPTLEAVLLDHPVLLGADLDENNQVQVFEPNVMSGDYELGNDVTFVDTNGVGVGNGTLIARTGVDVNGVELDYPFIIEWESGIEFYEGSGQIAGGHRLLFSAGNHPPTGGYGGAYDLTDEGLKLYINAVYYMLGEEPLVKAFAPDPADGEVDVSREPILSWVSGVVANKQDVYYGTSFDDVNEATRDDPRGVLVAQDQNDTTYEPDMILDYGVTYYWRVDGINDENTDSPWKGDVWNFQALNYPIVIEDFEDYNDYPPNEIFMTWLDGYGVPTNGSTAGYPQPDFVGGQHYMEDTIVHSGDWSMPLFYDNSVGLSEVTRTLNQDWTIEDVSLLGLYYYGDPANAPEPMFVGVDNAVVTNDDADAALVTEWTLWKIPLQEFVDQGVNLSNIGSMTIGFGNKANPVAGGEGHVFFDDIRLYFPDVEAN
jgi:hypothetical protein